MLRQVEEINSAERINSLTKELVSAYEEINLIYDIDDALMGMIDPKDGMDAILREAADLVKAGWGFAVLLKEERDGIELVRKYGGLAKSDDGENGPWLEQVKSMVESAKGSIVDEMDGEESLHLFPGHGKGLLKVPLRTKKDVIGMICLGDKAGEKFFTSMDLKLINALVVRASIFIENMRLQIHFTEKQRIEQELALASTIQNGLLPDSPPAFEGYDIAAIAKVCTEVGGDYYDFIKLEGGDEALVMGDVSGHGIGPALIMSSARSSLRAMAGEKPSRLMERLNRIMVDDNKGKGMMTLFYAVLDPNKREMTYVNAGHDYPFVVRKNSRVDFLRSTGGLLGIFEDSKYHEESLLLNKGDLVCIYTDGITESVNSEGEQFGTERLVEAVKGLINQRADSIIEDVLEQVNAFSDALQPEDDITMMLIKVEG